jgi:hypothetical protein
MPEDVKIIWATNNNAVERALYVIGSFAKENVKINHKI